MIRQALAEKVKQAVWSLSRAEKLVRFASSVGSAQDENADRPEITATIQRKGDKSADPSTACAKPNKTDPEKPLAAFSPQGVGNCDTVRFTITNETDQTYYIAAFYVDALGGVQTAVEPGQGARLRRTLYSGSERSHLHDPDQHLGCQSQAPGGDRNRECGDPRDPAGFVQDRAQHVLADPANASAMQQTRSVEDKSAHPRHRPGQVAQDASGRHHRLGHPRRFRSGG